ncbi:hypothetical protein V5799_003261 [Amblyomma americanum]|uniref:CCHC-type domain-containing protein n=1 Tax=Amblyomma americanum TaxID=6943 RepID=A0AAQ4D9G7_AMBAM
MQTTISSPSVVLQQPREPPIFQGSPGEDPEDWLEKFERVARYNRWAEDSKLQHVFFSLEGAARTWFENRESSITTWNVFKDQFLKDFTTVIRRERADLLLQSRTQLPNESILVYFEEMAKLFRRADPDMTEQKKLRYLMRGVKEQIFAGLVRNPPSTVAEFLSEATTMEKTLDMRLRQYERQPLAMTAATTDISNTHMLRETVRAIVREELQKLFTATPPAPTVTALSEVIREEVQQALTTPAPFQPSTAPPQMTYAAVARRAQPPPTRLQKTPASFRPPPPARPAPSYPRKSDIWRTPNYRPLCYHCGEPGHLYCNCRYRQMDLPGFPADAPRPQPGQRPREINDYLAESAGGTRRSPSPRRRSYGDFPRGRSPSPRQEN